MVLSDTTLLLLLIKPDAPVPGDGRGLPPDRVGDRIAFLVDTLENAGERILVPTPVLSELIIRSKLSALEVIEKLNKYACFEICPFDVLSAVEMAELTKKEAGGGRLSRSDTYAKLKFDRQIVAIAKVRGARVIFSNDGHIENAAKLVGIETIGVRDLPLPPDKEPSASDYADNPQFGLFGSSSSGEV